jgi:hypothetical protein
MLAITKSTFRKQNHLVINSPLTIEDFTVTDIPEPTYHHLIASVTSGVVLEMKPEVVEQIIERFSTDKRTATLRKTCREIYIQSIGFSLLTARNAAVTETFTFQGIRTEEKKIERFEDKLKLTKDTFTASDSIVAETIAKFNEELADAANRCNEAFEEGVRNFVVNLNVKDEFFENYLDEQNKQTVADNDKRLAEVESQIEALLKQKSEISAQTYGIKRKCIETKLIETQDEPVANVVRALENDHTAIEDEEASSLNSFNQISAAFG